MNRLAAVVAATVLAGAPIVVLSAPALAYQPKCQTTGSGATSSSTPAQNQPVQFTATFTDCNGQGRQGVSVVFSASTPTGCSATLSQQTGTTDSNGSASTTATLSGQCAGATNLSAQGAGAVAGAAITAPPATGGGGSHAISTPTKSAGLPPAAVLGAVVVVVAAGGGGALALRRVRT